MGLIRTAILGGLGYLGYKAYKSRNNDDGDNGAAFAEGQPKGQVRQAGSGATATKGDTMSPTDEALDETFPASDATAKY